MNRLLLLLTCLVWAVPCGARIITVDNNGPADFNNIQAAINDANNGDTIIVADGTYTGSGNRQIDFGGRAITLCSEGGPENCIIDCEDLGKGFIFDSGEDENSVVIGFTITHGRQWCDPCGCPFTWFGGGIYCEYSSPTIRECIICDNYAHYGGGIYICDSTAKVINCVITNNEGTDGGGGIYCEADVSVVNCTIAENLAGVYEGGGLLCDGEVTVVNSILWGNTPDQIENWGSVTAFLNDIEGGWSGANINADPCFANPVNRDYHLKSEAGRWDPVNKLWITDAATSLCIDLGYDGFYPGLDYTSELWPHGKSINIGAYGGTPQASMSLSDAGNIADLDDDDDVDYADVGVFVDEWLSQEALLSEDLDRNGIVDFNDFAIFSDNWRWQG